MNKKKLIFIGLFLISSTFLLYLFFIKPNKKQKELFFNSKSLFIQENLDTEKKEITFIKAENLHLAGSSENSTSGNRYELKIPKYNFILDFWEKEDFSLKNTNNTNQNQSGFLTIPPITGFYTPIHSKISLYRISDDFGEITSENIGLLYKMFVKEILNFNDRSQHYKTLKDYELKKQKITFEERSSYEKERYTYLVKNGPLPKVNNDNIKILGNKEDWYGGMILNPSDFCDSNEKFATKNIPGNTWNQSKNCIETLEKNGIRIIKNQRNQTIRNPTEVSLLWNKKHPRYLWLGIRTSYEDRKHQIWRIK